MTNDERWEKYHDLHRFYEQLENLYSTLDDMKGILRNGDAGDAMSLLRKNRCIMFLETAQDGLDKALKEIETDVEESGYAL